MESNSELRSIINAKANELRAKGQFSAIAVLSRKSGIQIASDRIIQFISNKVDTLIPDDRGVAIAQGAIPTTWAINDNGDVEQKAVVPKEKALSSVMRDVKEAMATKLQAEINNSVYEEIQAMTQPLPEDEEPLSFSEYCEEILESPAPEETVHKETAIPEGWEELTKEEALVSIPVEWQIDRLAEKVSADTPDEAVKCDSGKKTPEPIAESIEPEMPEPVPESPKENTPAGDAKDNDSHAITAEIKAYCEANSVNVETVSKISSDLTRLEGGEPLFKSSCPNYKAYHFDVGGDSAVECALCKELIPGKHYSLVCGKCPEKCSLIALQNAIPETPVAVAIESTTKSAFNAAVKKPDKVFTAQEIEQMRLNATITDATLEKIVTAIAEKIGFTLCVLIFNKYDGDELRDILFEKARIETKKKYGDPKLYDIEGESYQLWMKGNNVVIAQYLGEMSVEDEKTKKATKEKQYYERTVSAADLMMLFKSQNERGLFGVMPERPNVEKGESPSAVMKKYVGEQENKHSVWTSTGANRVQGVLDEAKNTENKNNTLYAKNQGMPIDALAEYIQKRCESDAEFNAHVMEEEKTFEDFLDFCYKAICDYALKTKCNAIAVPDELVYSIVDEYYGQDHAIFEKYKQDQKALAAFIEVDELAKRREKKLAEEAKKKKSAAKKKGVSVSPSPVKSDAESDDEDEEDAREEDCCAENEECEEETVKDDSPSQLSFFGA